jgi:hypothetical protein
MAGSARVKGFLPSTNGFQFSNSWPHQPDISIPFLATHINIGDAANGLCGGMAFAVRDFFEESLPIPRTAVNPALHSPLYDYIVRRLFDSFDIPGGVRLFMSWQLPTRDQFKDTVQGEWPKIKQALDGGSLVPLGLIRTRSFWPGDLGKNHQVLTYGYDEDASGRITLRICDPNNPMNDDVTLSFTASNPDAKDMAYAVSGAAASHDSEDFTLGCFVQTYRHASPRGVTDVHTARVVAGDANGHIVELSLPFGAGWSQGDLSALSDAPSLAAGPSGYVTPLDSTLRVVFCGADAHLHEIRLVPGSGWSYDDLTVHASAPLAAGSPRGYVSPFDHVPRVVYRGDDGHVHEISLNRAGVWSTGDLSALLGAPDAVGDPSEYVTPLDRTARVVFRGADGHIHEISLAPGAGWSYGDLTAHSGAPDAAGNPWGYVSLRDETPRVVFRRADGHIHEISLAPHGWSAKDLIEITGAMAASGDPHAYVSSAGTCRVVYRAVDGHVHEISLAPGGGWATDVLSALAGAPVAAGDPFGYVTPLDRTSRVVYRGGDRHLHELSLAQGGTWSTADLTAVTGAPAAATGPTAYLG